MILTVIEHAADCPLDRFADWLLEPGTTTSSTATPGTTTPSGAHDRPTLRIVRAWAGDPVPVDATTVGDGLIVLGGPGHAYDDAGQPWLPATRALMADAVRTGLPTLGVCLGAQLLAVATGGRVQVAAPPGREAGVVDVHPRPDAARDPLLGALAADVPADHPLAGGVLLAAASMHADAVVDLPPTATWLASSRLYPYQAFRVGAAAWGLQFHPEVSEPTFAAWAARHDDVDDDAVLGELRDRADQVTAGGRALAHRFVEVVAQASAAATNPDPDLALAH